MTYYKPITPGEYLMHEFLMPLKLTQAKLAKDLNVSVSRISGIIHGTRSITADTAIRFSLYFKTTPEMWLNLQSQYELQIIKHNNLIKEHIQPLKKLVNLFSL